jgi:hypothetical protein
MRFYVSSQMRLAGCGLSPATSPKQAAERFRPWHVVGAVAPDAAPPHGLSREGIEKAIDAQGFQLWRLKVKAKAD